MSDASTPQKSPDVGPAEQGAEEAPAAADRARVGIITGRWVLVILTLAVLTAVFHGQIGRTIRRTVASYHADSASEQLQEGNVPAALASIERAIDWLPGDAALIYLRAQIHAESEDWEDSLSDYSRVTDELAPNFALAYAKRAEVYQQCADFRRALADIDQAIALSPTDDPGLLNHRAYVRALAGEDLELALADIQLAIELFSRHQQRGRDAEVPAALLDTRGYTRYRLGQHDVALEDVEQALRQLQADRERRRKSLVKMKRPVGAAMRRFDKIQAEIVYHRGLIRQAVGDVNGAHEDLALAKDLGYQPPCEEVSK